MKMKGIAQTATLVGSVLLCSNIMFVISPCGITFVRVAPFFESEQYISGDPAILLSSYAPVDLSDCVERGVFSSIIEQGCHRTHSVQQIGLACPYGIRTPMKFAIYKNLKNLGPDACLRTSSIKPCILDPARARMGFVVQGWGLSCFLLLDRMPTIFLDL